MSSKILFPIDAVYIWVDDSDPVWRAKRNAALAQSDAIGAQLHESAKSDCRFHDNGELRYSLRSLARFAPWIRRVYLLTDGQKPAWLDETSVRLVRHEDVFPKEATLPVFNSNAIEAVQYRIPGLSEHFISLNDDFIFGHLTSELDFFLPNGKPRIWVSRRSASPSRRFTEEELLSMVPHAAGVIRSRQLVNDRFKTNFTHGMRHVPKPMTIAAMESLWKNFPTEMSSVMRSQFRSCLDVVIPMLCACQMLATGTAVPRTINGPVQFIDALRGKLRHLGASSGDQNFAWKCRLIQHLHPLTFCLNDSEKAGPEDHMTMINLLKELFPVPSRFEIESDAC